MVGGVASVFDENHEHIAIFDEEGKPTGQTKSRELVHRDGDWHPTAHVYVFDSKGRILLARRSPQKDISAGKLQFFGGHLSDTSLHGEPAELPESIRAGALREAGEELGIELDEARLIQISADNEIKRSTSFTRNGQTIYNNERSTIFFYQLTEKEELEAIEHYNTNETDALIRLPFTELMTWIEAQPNAFSGTLQMMRTHGQRFFEQMQFELARQAGPKTSDIKVVGLMESAHGGGPRRLVMQRDGTTLAEARFTYDSLGQLTYLTISKDPEETTWPDAGVPMGKDRTFHMHFEADGTPRIWIAETGKPGWVYSGYRFEQGTRGPKGRLTHPTVSYVTVSHFTDAAGVVTPALETFDHDEVYTFAQRLKRLYGKMTIVNFDYHRDDREFVQSKLDIGNWVRFIKLDRLAERLLWVVPLLCTSPQGNYSPAGIDAAASDPKKLPLKGAAVLVTYDFDYFAVWRTRHTAAKLLQQIRGVVDAYSGVAAFALGRG